MSPSTSAEADELRATVAETSWYHTIDLPGGVTTPGQVDCRPAAGRTLIPPRLDGARVLDVGTWDGFWAFELERRGAEVITVDVPDIDALDWPPRTRIGQADIERRARMEAVRLGAGFELAKRALGSLVERKRISVYNLADAGLGTFDLVFVGSILVHLRDPVRALEAVRSVASGPVLLNESIDVVASLTSPRTARARFAGDGDEVLWWHSNLAGVVQISRSAGLALERRSRPFFIPWGAGYPRPSPVRVMHSLRSSQGRELAISWLAGITHVSLATRAEP